MLLAHEFPGSTNDVDAVPVNASFDEIKAIAEEIAKVLKIDHDWLNPHFQSFTIYLPSNATSRMTRVYSGRRLVVDSLGAEDILIMKLMAGRSKDYAHIVHLIRRGVDMSVVEDRLNELVESNMYKDLAEKALDLLYSLTEE
nr:hypothetical protein BdHM001_36380 [Bdellovibrio sp. HM001]